MLCLSGFELYSRWVLLLYGCKTWIINKDVTWVPTELNAFATSCYRIILNIKHFEKVSYDDRIYDLTGTSPNCYLRSSHVSSSSFALFCAWRRMNPLTSTCFVSPATGRRPPGRARKPFSNQVQEYRDRLQQVFLRE